MSLKIRIAIIGGGAAGYFAAIEAAKRPQNQVFIFEKSNKSLSKVRISGGGRCNVTHACFDNKLLTQNYPRGAAFLESIFNQFTTTDTVEWFESKGVKLKTEADGRMFPVTDSSESIIHALEKEAARFDVTIRHSYGISSIEKLSNKGFRLNFLNHESIDFDKVIVASGGNPNASGYAWLLQLGHQISEIVPSLFTFNTPKHPFNALMGLSMPKVSVKIEGLNYDFTGPILITHWGFSGPVILKLSAFAALELNAKKYEFYFVIDWLPAFTKESIQKSLQDFITSEPKKIMMANPKFEIPSRLWKAFCECCQIGALQRNAEVGSKKLLALVNLLKGQKIQAQGKTTFKEEFVTAGGILLEEINAQTMESKLIPGLFFAGEVLDIDGVTGGFNFQAAWSTGFVAGKNC